MREGNYYKLKDGYQGCESKAHAEREESVSSHGCGGDVRLGLRSTHSVALQHNKILTDNKEKLDTFTHLNAQN